jgi:peptidoglycan/xylan/chitin deacetylase (PgdA/CDA1 family)
VIVAGLAAMPIGYPVRKLSICSIIGLTAFVASQAASQEFSSQTLVLQLDAANCAFRLDHVKASPGVILFRRGDAWLGREKCETTLVCQKTVGKSWEEMSVECVPQGDGEVSLRFYGDYFDPLFGGEALLSWIDTVSVQGASLGNGDFEAAGPDGKPEGWWVGDKFSPRRYSRDGTIAHSGKCCLAVGCAGGEAGQTIKVARGRPCRISLWVRAIDPQHLQAEPVPCEFPPPRYTQEFQIVFRGQQAAKASVAVAPLYNDYAWAISSRWDDNNPAHLTMRDVLARHGCHGTFYLNGIQADWSRIPPSINSDNFGRELIKNGNSIGGHSLTHPFLTTCNRNRIFEEVAGVRVQWEAAVDMPVLSYAFSFCNFYNFAERYAVQADIARVLQRAGFYGIASEPPFELLPTDMILSPIMPPDGLAIDWFAEAALASRGFPQRHPNLTYSMHTWYRTPEAWAKFEKDLDRYGHRPDWWYCNQNQYAAYRYQFQHSRLVASAPQGRVLKCRVERPVLLDLNDAVPLTFRVTGVKPEEIEAVQCASAECVPSDRKTGVCLFHLEHDRNQALPAKIGLAPPNVENRAELAEGDQDPKFAGVRALLHFHGGKLRLALDNQSPQPLTGLRVTYRLPLAWNEGVVRRQVADLAAKSRREETITPTRAESDYKYNSGTAFFLAQLDFRQGPLPGRLHAVCLCRQPAVDHSYPQGGFLKLGPFALNLVDLAKLGGDLQAGRIQTQPWLMAGDARLAWKADEPRDITTDVEFVALRPAGNDPQAFVLRTDIVSPRQQIVELAAVTDRALAAYLNNESVKGRREIRLRQGANRLWLVFPACDAAFMRLTRPGTSERVTDVRFAPPPIAAAAAPYRPAPPEPGNRR